MTLQGCDYVQINYVNVNNPCGVRFDFNSSTVIYDICRDDLTCALQERVVDGVPLEVKICKDNRGVAGDTCSNTKPCAAGLMCSQNEYGVQTCGGVSFWKNQDYYFNTTLTKPSQYKNRFRFVFAGCAVYFVASCILLYLFYKRWKDGGYIQRRRSFTYSDTKTYM
jgi:hypothetical protein